MLRTCLNTGILLHKSFKPLGGSGSLRKARSLPTSRRASTDSWPMPNATRFGVPNKLAKTGIVDPLGFSNKIAGPPALSVRSAISVISSSVSISIETLFSSPIFSSWAMKSLRSLYFIWSPNCNYCSLMAVNRYSPALSYAILRRTCDECSLTIWFLVLQNEAGTIIVKYIVCLRYLTQLSVAKIIRC